MYSEKKWRGHVLSLWGSLVLLSLLSCRSASSSGDQAVSVGDAPVAPLTINVPVASFTDSSGTFNPHTSQESTPLLGSTGANQWLAYEVTVPETGRYQTTIRVANSNARPGTLWVEDYYGNKDDRTYNITGDILIKNTGGLNTPQGFSRDGSPMSKGVHPIKLHFKDAGLYVQSISFTLLKAHQETPLLLTQNTSGKALKLVWSDEFNGTGLPDTSKWIYDLGDWGWGNNELQYYTEGRQENARQENGNLIIEARKGDLGHEWTSARLTTRGKVSFVHGRIEFRAQVPPNKGNWAAGWTLGDAYRDEMSWPYCGEIDIMESVGYEMDDATGNGKAHASVHCGAYYFKLGNQPTAVLDVENMNKAFHTYAIDWTSESIKAYVDDQLYFTYADNSTELTWPFSQPQNLILNLAMGGGWGGQQGLAENITSQKMVIDYVRVYAFE
ncbi:MAG: hypothetical protein DA408_10980 [Bacteroidetes bacterium]|nr:MAG: hypothetical protein C7N36_15560 [Bacteroidota bacterium]PTM12378.1 MAG: hypothetical protein DA408_10980 [Bacteroidota bacterium]